MDACHGLCLGPTVTHRLGVRHTLTADRRWYERRDTVPSSSTTTGPSSRRHDPNPFTYPATMRTRAPGPPAGHLDVDVSTRPRAGIWARIPASPRSPTDEGHLAPPADVILCFPRDEWWAAWFSPATAQGRHQPPAVRRDDGDLEFRDLSLDVVVLGPQRRRSSTRTSSTRPATTPSWPRAPAQRRRRPPPDPRPRGALRHGRIRPGSPTTYSMLGTPARTPLPAEVGERSSPVGRRHRWCRANLAAGRPHDDHPVIAEASRTHPPAIRRSPPPRPRPRGATWPSRGGCPVLFGREAEGYCFLDHSPFGPARLDQGARFPLRT